MNKLPEQFSVPGNWEQARGILMSRESETARLLNYMKDGFIAQSRTITVSAPMVSSDSVVLVDSTAADVTLTLMDAAVCREKRLAIKKIDSSANNVIAAAAGSQKIDGSATYSTNTQYAGIEIISDGTNWFKV